VTPRTEGKPKAKATHSYLKPDAPVPGVPNGYYTAGFFDAHCERRRIIRPQVESAPAAQVESGVMPMAGK
jgi:hypothetical protein